MDIDKLKKIIKKAQDGDENALLKLIDKFQPLVKSLLAKYSTKGINSYDLEDMKQELGICLWETIINYDEELCDNPLIHIKNRITRNASHFFRRLKFNFKYDSYLTNAEDIEEILSDSDSDSLFVPQSGYEAEDEIADRLDLEMALSKLDERSRFCIEKYYFEGWTHQEIADALGLERSGVTKFIDRCASRLKKMLE